MDISALLDGTVPEPPAPQLGRRTDGHCLFYPGQVNWVFGDPESGKSWRCLVCVTEALSAGRRVLMIDLDHDGAPSTVHRLLALGARPDALRDSDLFRYCEPEDAAEVRQVVQDSRNWRPAVAVVDSIGELLPMCGANTNSADKFTVMHTKVLKPLAKAGAAVLAVDHLAKNADSRAVGPGGTAAKRRAIGGSSIRVKVKQPFTPGHGGSATLVVTRIATGVCAPTARSATVSRSRAPSNCWHSPRARSRGLSTRLPTVSATRMNLRHRRTCGRWPHWTRRPRR